ncbi:MAG: serine/threonine-protein kinase [Nakamurella sp.]
MGDDGAGGALVGTDLGPYALGEVLGRGGMSTVYRAHDRRSGVEVACKVMNPRVSADPAVRARFADQVCVIDHPNVIPIYEIGDTAGRLFVAMRLVLGTDVQTALPRGGLGPARALRIFGQLSSALTALHRRGLLHLDVKPANVLLERDRVDHVYLMDYGLQEARPNVLGAFLGTPNYASPEHLRGTAIGPSSDVYSLTCVLFALLAGRPPFTGRLTEVIGGHLRGDAPSLAAVTGLPARIDRVIAAGLHSDPARRPACPETLAEAARTALAGC